MHKDHFQFNLLKMPINKFGHHFLYESVPHKLTASATSLNLSSYRSVCILTLRGTPKSDTLALTFENNANVYKFEMNCIIQQVDTSDDSIHFSLNKNNLISPKSFIGTTINKGDFITIFRDSSQSSSSPIVFVQFILLCPLVVEDE